MLDDVCLRFSEKGSGDLRFTMISFLNKRRAAVVSAAVVLLLICAIAAMPWLLPKYGKIARRNWKNEAIPQISQWVNGTNWQVAQLGLLTNGVSSASVYEAGWLSDKMILMTNGEWLVYRSHCPKKSPRLVQDIFLAKGSNGKWYYSTFHFCVEMIGLRMEQEEHPPSLAMFVHEYNLREFDGVSDECLKETDTWPASWRERKQSEPVNVEPEPGR